MGNDQPYLVYSGRSLFGFCEECALVAGVLERESEEGDE